ncbi:cytochrome P450 family protein [Ceratobasidium sp. AG-Ba]|nr:cytochrome P450 family protein [Ceratobasidium sp. AG-Ba]
MLSSIYGYDASYPHDELVQNIETALTQFCEAAVPSNFLVNTVPWLVHVPAWFPGAGWKRKATIYRASRDKVVNNTFEWTKSQIIANTASPSILKNLLTDVATSELSQYDIENKEDIIRWAAGTLYAGNSVLTIATEATFVLAMLLHPEVQKKAQAELDTVLRRRLPELSDRPKLPYMNAVMKETMRWRPVVPMGVPRVATEDTVYRGYLIPKRAIVRNSETYSNPEEFNPDRFLNNALPPAPVFGLGRRDCPGAHFAESSFFLMASTFLTIFNVAPKPGRPFVESKPSSNALSSHPIFESIVTPRSDQHKQMLEQWVEI